MGLHCLQEFYVVWSPPTPFIHLIPLVHTAPTTLPYSLVFKCPKFFFACTFVLAIPPVWIVFMRLAGSIPHPHICSTVTS